MSNPRVVEKVETSSKVTAENKNALMFAGRGRKYTVTGENEFALTFDILEKESHGWTLQATPHPVEKGNPVTDHVQQTVQKGSITGYISNFSLYKADLVSNDAQDVFDTLWKYKENAQIVTIVTVLKLYEDVIITNVKASRSGNVGEAQAFDITFQEFRQVDLATTSLSGTQVRAPTQEDIKNSDDAKKKGKKKDTGKQGNQRVFSFDLDNTALKYYNR